MTKQMKFIFTLVCVPFLWSEGAQACHPSLKGLVSPYLAIENGDLCAFADRLQRARDVLESYNIDATRIADVRAPRFIAMKDWKRQKDGGFLRVSSYNPRYIYDRKGQPEGSVWDGWENASQIVDKQAQHVHRLALRGYTSAFDIDMKWILNVHATAMSQAEPTIAGNLRDSPVVGPAYQTRTAPTLVEIKTATEHSYPSFLDTSKQIVTWVDTVCESDIPFDVRKLLRSPDRRFHDEDLPRGGQPFQDPENPALTKKCGFYRYARFQEIPQQFTAWRQDLVSRMNSLLSGQRSSATDPIYIAARAQRWFVSIHPFKGGNGRTSRFIMDYITQTVGLPASTLDNMDLDLVTTEAEWARHVGNGMIRVLKITEACAQNPNTAACEVVP